MKKTDSICQNKRLNKYMKEIKVPIRFHFLPPPQKKIRKTSKPISIFIDPLTVEDSESEAVEEVVWRSLCGAAVVWVRLEHVGSHTPAGKEPPVTPVLSVGAVSVVLTHEAPPGTLAHTCL